MKRRVQVVTVSKPALKRAFRKAHPGQTGAELTLAWLTFWAEVAVTGTVVAKVLPVAAPEPVPMKRLVVRAYRAGA